MQRAAVGLGAFLSTLMPCLGVLAHGEPPVAFSVLSHDAEGARAVRLSTGVALRRAPQRFQFVCPAAWGDLYAAPLAALADGTIVVGGTRGLMLLDADGHVRVHPDPAAVGDSDDVVKSARGVFSLRTTAEGSELLAVDPGAVRVLWKDTKSLYSLAALDDALVLVRAADTSLEQVVVAAADGKELERQLVPLGSPVDYAFARVNSGVSYTLVVFRTSAALGTLRMGAFTPIAQGELTIAGPLSLGEGMLVAPDGQLSELVAGELRPLASSDGVLCLAQNDELPYACHPDGIARVSAQALGEPLFRFAWLSAPDLDLLPAGEPRDRCNAQWQDMRVDLSAAGIAPPEEALRDGGSGLVDGAISEAELGAEAGAAEGDIAGGGAAMPPVAMADAGPMIRPATGDKGPGSCGLLPGTRSAGALSSWLAALALMLVSRTRARAGWLRVTRRP